MRLSPNAQKHSILGAYVNGQKLVKATGQTVQIKANFEGKTSGSTDLCPHVAKSRYSTSVALSPSDSTNTAEFPTSAYIEVSSLDGISRNFPRIGAGLIDQHIFSFDLI
jgi:hypothetical protein